MKYPSKLHSLHNEFPLAPELREATDEMLSAYQHEQKAKFGVNPSGGGKKLMCTLYDKKNMFVIFGKKHNYMIWYDDTYLGT